MTLDRNPHQNTRTRYLNLVPNLLLLTWLCFLCLSFPVLFLFRLITIFRELICRFWRMKSILWFSKPARKRTTNPMSAKNNGLQFSVAKKLPHFRKISTRGYSDNTHDFPKFAPLISPLWFPDVDYSISWKPRRARTPEFNQRDISPAYPLMFLLPANEQQSKQALSPVRVRCLPFIANPCISF